MDRNLLHWALLTFGFSIKATVRTIGEPEPGFYFTRHFDYLVIVFIDGSVASYVWCFLALEHSQKHVDT